MNKFLLALAVLFISPFTLATPLDDDCPQFAKFGHPISNVKGNIFICHTAYSIEYSPKSKLSLYSEEHLIKSDVEGIEKRTNYFKADPLLDKSIRAANSDYDGSGFDRGHLAPVGDFRNDSNELARRESFYLSNMVPQVPNMNRAIWKKLEIYTRGLVIEYGEAYITTGPIINKNPKKIGNGITIPEKMYKIIYLPSADKFEAFIIKNTATKNLNLDDYETTVEEVEKATGLNFNPNKGK